MAVDLTARSIDMVADLLRMPFSKHPFAEKNKIISRGRPTPKMDALTKCNKGFVRHFTAGNYQRYEWLTASSEHNKLFCWSRLLFSTSPGTWNTSGFSSLNSFTRAAVKHQVSERHIMNVETFGEARVDLQLDEQRRRETSLHNERVKKNRDILKRLIDCVMFLGQQELSFRGHDERSESLNQGTLQRTRGVKERFLKFEDVTDKKRANDLAALIIKVLESYDCKTKLVAQCYDGAAVMASGLNRVQALVKETIPQALFVHCYAHTLHLVMSQGASKIKECKIFFANLGGLSAFFTRSPKRTKLLDDFCARRLPRVSIVRWNFNSRLVCTVHEKRAELVKLFQHILDHAEVFDHETLHCASGHLSQLKSFDFCFFLFAFVLIFDFADVLFGILQSKILDVQFSLARIAEFCQSLEGERGKFDGIFEATVEAVGQPIAARGKPDPRVHCRKLHAAVIDSTLTQINDRSFPALFRKSTGKRRFSATKPAAASSPRGTKINFYLLPNPLTTRTPQGTEELTLLMAGLGKRVIIVPDNSNHSEEDNNDNEDEEDNGNAGATNLFDGEPDHLVPSSSAFIVDSDLFLMAGCMIGHCFLNGGPALTGLSPAIVHVLCGGTPETALMKINDCPDLDLREKITLVIGRTMKQVKQITKGLKETMVWPLICARPDVAPEIFPREMSSVLTPECILECIKWPKMTRTKDDDDDDDECSVLDKSRITGYLWQFTENASSDELKALVKFWVGWEAPTATLIVEVVDSSLPKSSTCFETLRLPARYKDYMTFKKDLIACLQTSDTGFGLV
ncbi:hypothetical protein ABVT39_022730 [Epinephelus coioides]